MKLKNLFKSTLYAIAISLFFTVFALIGIEQSLNGVLDLGSYGFTKAMLGALLIGLGYGIPTFIYDLKSMSIALKSVIYMCTGVGIMILVFLKFGFIQEGYGLGDILKMLIVPVGIAFLLWYAQYMKYKKVAKLMNEKLKDNK